MAKLLQDSPYVRARFKPPVEPGLYVTGQTTQRVAGDDGDYEAGYTQENRFRIHNAAVLYDRWTGLYWPRAWDGNGWRGSAIGFTWAGALDDEMDIINAAAVGGFTDWRLPNVEELSSLVDMESGVANQAYWQDTPWLNNGDGFALWTSTTTPNDTTYAVMVSLLTGARPKLLKTDNVKVGVVAVRGGLL